ncbi:MAG: lipoprotein [Pseudomonadota bacterium]
MPFGNGVRWIVALLMIGIVAACGRAGPLEPPPGSATAPAEDGQGAVQEAPKEDKPFVLDGLL